MIGVTESYWKSETEENKRRRKTKGLEDGLAAGPT
jgi:hypothetical protein